jgi:hypothetical protein
MRWDKRTTNGYWRHPTAGPPAVVREEPVLEASGEKGTLAVELEAVTRLGLQKLDHILRLPTDPGNGNILRAQTTAAATAVNAQLRADETKMKQAQKGDVIARLLEIMAIEEAKLIEMDRAKREKEEHKTLPGKNASERCEAPLGFSFASVDPSDRFVSDLRAKSLPRPRGILTRSDAFRQ